MILNRIIKRITKITKFEVKNLITVFKWKMPFFYSQEGVNVLVFIIGCTVTLQNSCFLHCRMAVTLQKSVIFAYAFMYVNFTGTTKLIYGYNSFLFSLAGCLSTTTPGCTQTPPTRGRSRGTTLWSSPCLVTVV